MKTQRKTITLFLYLLRHKCYLNSIVNGDVNINCFKKISEELQQSYDDLNCDIKNTFQGKNAGKILRLSGILSYMFRVLDKEVCITYEKEKAEDYESTPCTIESVNINCLGMDAAINLVDLSHKQMMALLGFVEEK